MYEPDVRNRYALVRNIYSKRINVTLFTLMLGIKNLLPILEVKGLIGQIGEAWGMIPKELQEK